MTPQLRNILLSAVAATVLAVVPQGEARAGSATVAFGQASAAEIARRLNGLEAEIASIRAATGVQGGGALGASALTRLNEIEQELRVLTRDVEELRFRIDRIAEDATRRFGDIEFRLTELEGGDIGALGETPVVGSLGGGSVDGGTAPLGPEVTVAERVELDRAIREVQQGRSDLAEERLRAFITAYPDSPLAGEARYWIGETQFIRGNFSAAAKAYLEGYNASVAERDAAGNLLKLGVSLGRLGQRQEACLTLEEVARRFPGESRTVDEARGEAARLSCG